MDSGENDILTALNMPEETKEQLFAKQKFVRKIFARRCDARLRTEMEKMGMME